MIWDLEDHKPVHKVDDIVYDVMKGCFSKVIRAFVGHNYVLKVLAHLHDDKTPEGTIYYREALYIYKVTPDSFIEAMRVYTHGKQGAYI